MTSDADIPEFGSEAYASYLRDRFPACRNMDHITFQAACESVALYAHLRNYLHFAFNKTPVPLSHLRPAQEREAELGDPRLYPDLDSILQDLKTASNVSIAGSIYDKGSMLGGIDAPELNASLCFAQRCHFVHLSAPKSSWLWSNLAGSECIQCRFSESDFHRTRLNGSKHYAVDFSNATMRKTYLQGSTFELCDFPRVKFSGTKASDTHFFGNEEEMCNMRGAFFSNNCNFRDAKFEYCDLTDADMLKCDDMVFAGATFSHCKMPAKLKVMLEFKGAKIDKSCTVGRPALTAPKRPLALEPPAGYEAWKPHADELSPLQQATTEGPDSFLARMLTQEREQGNGTYQAHRQKGPVAEEVVDAAIKSGAVTSLAARRAKENAAQEEKER